MLRELAETGMEITRALRREVQARVEAGADEPAHSVADLGLAFSRVARAVRQTLALEVKLEEGELKFDAASSASSEEQSEVARKLKAMVLRLAGAASPADEDEDEDDDERAEDLRDRPDTEAVGPERPFGEVVAGVCGDLGVERDFSVWSDQSNPAPARGEGILGGADLEPAPNFRPSSPAGAAQQRNAGDP
jgi:hypothetical protein